MTFFSSLGSLGIKSSRISRSERILPELQALPLLLGQRPELRVLALLDELLRRRQILHYPLIFPVRLHDGCKIGVSLGEPLELLGIVDHFRAGQLLASFS